MLDSSIFSNFFDGYNYIHNNEQQSRDFNNKITISAKNKVRPKSHFGCGSK